MIDEYLRSFVAEVLVKFVASPVVEKLSSIKAAYRPFKGEVVKRYVNFGPEENAKALRTINGSFCYLGVTGNSVIEHFKAASERLPADGEYRFLLMDPDAPALERQVAYEKGVALNEDLSALDATIRKEIKKELAAARARCKAVIKCIKSHKFYKEGQLRIALHGEFTPWWQYIINDDKLYHGSLEIGRPGHNSPAMVIQRGNGVPSLYDTFKNTYEKTWATARELKK